MTIRTKFFLFCTFFAFLTAASAQQTSHDQSQIHDSAQIHGSMEFLASDALQGRASGSHDELLAATYLASELREIGIEPAGDSGGYIQNVSGEFNFRDGKKQWNTRNVIGVLRGRDQKLKDEVILLTAHMDHLGLREAVNGCPTGAISIAEDD